MKKIYSFLAIILISCFSFGQPAGTMAPPSFSKCTPTLLQTQGDVTQNVFGTDSKFPTYTKTVQVFEIPSTANFTIVGAIVWIGYLKVNGTAGNVSFDVVDFCGFTGMTWASKQAGFTVPNQYSPDATIGSPTVKSTSVLKTSTCLDNASIIVFDTPVTVNNNTGSTCVNKIGLGIDFSAIGDDVIGMYSTNLNEGSLGAGNVYKEFAWQYEKGTDAWYTILGSSNGQINADMLVFPIIDMNAYNTGTKTNVCAGTKPSGIVENSDFFNGMKLSQSYPNPFKDKCLIEYELEKNAKVSLSIYDMLGNRVRFFDEGNKTAGSHSINIDVSNLKSGNYIYSLSSDGKLLTKMMSLVKEK